MESAEAKGRWGVAGENHKWFLHRCNTSVLVFLWEVLFL